MKHRGLGRVFQPSYTDKKTGKLKKSSRWHIEYWVNGKPHREGTGSVQRAVAVNLLKRRTGEAAIGRLLPGDVARTTFEELARLVKQDYEKNNRRTTDLDVVLKRLSSGFAGMKATEITPARISAYQAEQKKDDYANATINRDLAALKRAFRLGVKQGFVVFVPPMEMLREDNVRKGFFEPDDFQKFLKHLPDELQPLFRVAYITGWRVKSELLTREWQHVDFIHKKLRLDPGEAKSDEPREFPFTDDLKAILEAQRRGADQLQKTKGVSVHHVFFRPDGTPILTYRKAWDAAVKSSGVKRIPHDFRRTAVRNLEIAGVQRAVAMKMVGHKTESIYRRYAIVDEGMQQEAAKKLNTLHKMQAERLRQADTAE